jgi:hypothetical protein
VRDNILFFRPFDEGRYWSVIRACALDSDLTILAAGDMTEVRRGGGGGGPGSGKEFVVMRPLL